MFGVWIHVCFVYRSLLRACLVVLEYLTVAHMHAFNYIRVVSQILILLHARSRYLAYKTLATLRQGEKPHAAAYHTAAAASQLIHHLLSFD